MIELIAVIIGIAFVATASWFVLRKRYCPDCGKILLKNYLPNSKSIDKTPFGLPRAEPLVFECASCGKFYNTWQTYSPLFNKKKGTVYQSDRQ